MTMRVPRSIMLASLCTLALSACSSGVKETLGINKKAPDEFKVLSRPPLSMPPEFSLRPPADGSEGEDSASPREEAKSAVFGTDKKAPASNASANKIVLSPGKAETAVKPVSSGTLGGSNAEAVFLRNAGADTTDNGAREELSREEARKQWEEKSTLETLTTLPEKKEPVVDAKAEADRLKQNQTEGKPVTEGETPESQPSDRGILGNVFGF